MVESRRVADDECWHCEVRYKDRRRGKVCFMHRPDAAVRIAERLISIEIEHDRSKARRRLLGILEMYAELCRGDDAPFRGASTSPVAMTSTTSCAAWRRMADLRIGL